ncbi:MAG TPA: tryptophan--tRNA ligase, partial [Candidatus Obscuribacterales bacterium]
MAPSSQASGPVRVLSGIQPTGALTLGNYLGAISNWVDWQRSADETFIMVVDLHALTGTASHLGQRSRETAAALVACGIERKHSNLFMQSSVPEHTELAWVLSCVAPLGQLERMTQFKDKAEQRGSATLGLLSYPVLQAADVLLYQATHVPVGEDQAQHLELTRDLARAFNHRVAQNYFLAPQTVLGDFKRVMSLRDGTKKMSKSDPSDYSRINLTDSADLIAKKIKKAKTDSLDHFSYDPASRPELANLLTIFSTLSQQPIESLLGQFKSKVDFKEQLTDLLVHKVTPIGQRIEELLE